MSAEAIIAALNLSPHPEGGWYRQTWVAENTGRPSGTAILFLLPRGEVSHWHTVDATEIWFYHAGNPLILSRSATDAGPATDDVLGPDVLAGQSAQLIVP
ncbi:MAG: cupin domain-containing protein, partial [Alphaproteobacteria bacterium]|nr:cupin domain-containing protein [Alphaproteobacteria bacterium]